jgi:pyruvate carboxylase
VLEAMKMESNVVAPVSGVVKTILVGPGDSVKKGQVLVEFA